MNTRALVLLAGLFALLALAPACPPSPAPPEPPVVTVDASPTPPPADASTGAPDASQPNVDGGATPDGCYFACQHLRELGCPEAADLWKCGNACRVGGNAIADYRPACVVDAGSPSDLRARCGPAWKKGCPGR